MVSACLVLVAYLLHDMTNIAQPAVLGSSLWTVLDLLRTHQHSFPHVDVKYDPDTSLTPVVLHIRPHLDLLFSATHQRLHTISVRRLRDPSPPLTLRYRDSVLSSPQIELRRVEVNLSLGPTYDGQDLRYPGVSFSFDEDPLSHTHTERMNSRKPPGGTGQEDRMQQVKQILISQTAQDGETRDALSEVDECKAMYGELAEAIVKVSPVLTCRHTPYVLIYVSSPLRLVVVGILGS